MKKILVNAVVTPENVDYNKIYLFTDVSKFVRHPYNRELDGKLVKKYKASILIGASDELIGWMTIDIKTMQIYDGQHRIEAYKQASKVNPNIRPLKVIFINAPDSIDKQIQLIQDINNGKHWNNKDHINAHIDGDNDLKKLAEFCNSHKLLHKMTQSGKNKGKKQTFYRRGAAILTGDPTEYKKTLKNGTFKATNEQWDEAESVYKELMNIFDIIGVANQTDIPAFEGITNAWYAIRNDYKSQQKIRALPNGMEDFYDFVTVMDTNHTTSPKIWISRFKDVINNAYQTFVVNKH